MLKIRPPDISFIVGFLSGEIASLYKLKDAFIFSSFLIESVITYITE